MIRTYWELLPGRDYIWPENAVVRGVVVNGVLHEFPHPVHIEATSTIKWRFETCDEPMAPTVVKP